jgi:hypothetical protein
MTNLYKELEQIVSEGKTTWEQVSQEIIHIKIESEILRHVGNQYGRLIRAAIAPNFDIGRDVIICKPPNQYTLLRKREAWEQLSSKAKEVVDLVLDGELVNKKGISLCKNNGNISRTRLAQFVYERFKWPYSTINKVFNELKQYVKELEIA